MLKMTLRQQLSIGVILTALLVATRGHHLATIAQVLPSASWAVFFLAGVYLRPAWALAGLLGVAALLDAAAVGWAGVSDYCLSPAYIALLPAYGALWLAGRWYTGRYAFKLATLRPLTGALLAGIAVCEAVSSGSFYFLSGRFAEPNAAEFGARLLAYGPYYLKATAFWVGVAAIVHIVVAAVQRGAVKPMQA